jgi:pimeloyl-ACP methyl ester carboxylesterase
VILGCSKFNGAISNNSSFIKQIDNKQPMILVGHLAGGPMVAKLAADHPSWYKHVVILSGSLDQRPKTQSNGARS